MTTDRDLTWDEFEQRLVASGWTKEDAHAEQLEQELGAAGDCDGDLYY